jgi:hypothetical protein
MNQTFHVDLNLFNPCVAIFFGVAVFYTFYSKNVRVPVPVRFFVRKKYANTGNQSDY